MACVWTDDEAASLPAFYEPLLVADEAVLRDIVEEEILLALPSFPTHETECKPENNSRRSSHSMPRLTR